MANYRIESNRKGLVAKVQVYTKDAKTGKNKLISKRIYNEKNLTDAKFEKYVEKMALQFEEEVQQAYKEQNDYRYKILTFSQLGNEFVDNVKKNLSISYYDRAKEAVKRFDSFLEENNLSKSPITEIKVRDVQMFLNSFHDYQHYGSGNIRLKKDLPKQYSWRLLAREKIIDRCASYELKRNRKRITKEKALQICKFFNLEFSQYFEEVNKTQLYSTETVRGYRRILRTIFNEAVRYDWIAKNPVCQTKIGAGNNNSSLRPIAEKEVFSIQETKDFIIALDKIDDEYVGVGLNEDLGIFLNKGEKVSNLDELVRKLLNIKSVLLYDKDKSLLSSGVTSVVGDLNNLHYKIVVRPKRTTDRFVGLTGL